MFFLFVSSLLYEQHPGGSEILTQSEIAGKDATKNFVEIGHSADAVETLKKYRIGEIGDNKKEQEPSTSFDFGWCSCLGPIGVALCSIFYTCRYCKNKCTST